MPRAHAALAVLVQDIDPCELADCDTARLAARAVLTLAE